MEIPRPKSLRELVNEHRDVQKPVVDGLLRPGETMNIIAPPGTGKSRLALALAVSVAAGIPWIGRRCERGKVLVVSTDLPDRMLTARLERELDRLRSGDREAALANLDVLDMSRAAGMSASLERCLNLASVGEYSLIVVASLDGLVPAYAGSGRRGKALAIHDAIDAYASERKCAFVLVQQAQARRADCGHHRRPRFVVVCDCSRQQPRPAAGDRRCRLQDVRHDEVFRRRAAANAPPCALAPATRQVESDARDGGRKPWERKSQNTSARATADIMP